MDTLATSSSANLQFNRKNSGRQDSTGAVERSRTRFTMLGLRGGGFSALRNRAFADFLLLGNLFVPLSAEWTASKCDDRIPESEPVLPAGSVRAYRCAEFDS